MCHLLWHLISPELAGKDVMIYSLILYYYYYYMGGNP